VKEKDLVFTFIGSHGDNQLLAHSKFTLEVHVAVHLMKLGGRAQMDGFITITEAPLVHDDWTQYAKTPVVTTFGQFSLADTNVMSYCLRSGFGSIYQT